MLFWPRLQAVGKALASLPKGTLVERGRHPPGPCSGGPASAKWVPARLAKGRAGAVGGESARPCPRVRAGDTPLRPDTHQKVVVCLPTPFARSATRICCGCRCGSPGRPLRRRCRPRLHRAAIEAQRPVVLGPRVQRPTCEGPRHRRCRPPGDGRREAPSCSRSRATGNTKCRAHACRRFRPPCCTGILARVRVKMPRGHGAVFSASANGCGGSAAACDADSHGNV